MNPIHAKVDEREGATPSRTWDHIRSSDSLLDPWRATRIVREAVSASGWMVREVQSVELVKERPEGRRTLRFQLTARRAGGVPAEISWYGIQYPGTEGERTDRRLRYLRAAAAPEVLVPAAVGYSSEARLLLTSALGGRPLSGVLEDPIESRVAASLKRLGRALSTFHGIRVPGPPVRGAISEFPRHDAAREWLAVEEAERRMKRLGLEERFEERLLECGSVLRSELVEGAGELRSHSMIHRDLRPSHIIFGADGVSLIDLDRASLGEPESDLGTLIAHLILADVQKSGPVRLAPARAEALRAGYLAAGTLRQSRLAAYTSSALLRLAGGEGSGVARLAEPDRARLTGALIEEALPELSCKL